jgi:hypothetical protein
MNEILQYLKQHGERLDFEIAKATGIPLAQTHRHLAELTSKGEVMSCLSIKFENGKKIEAISCRLVGFALKPKPGAKPKVPFTLSKPH